MNAQGMNQHHSRTVYSLFPEASDVISVSTLFAITSY